VAILERFYCIKTYYLCNDRMLFTKVMDYLASFMSNKANMDHRASISNDTVHIVESRSFEVVGIILTSLNHSIRTTVTCACKNRPHRLDMRIENSIYVILVQKMNSTEFEKLRLDCNSNNNCYEFVGTVMPDLSSCSNMKCLCL